jgi:hypothetical protein
MRRLPRELPVGIHQAPQLNEGAHDRDVDLDGAGREKDA